MEAWTSFATINEDKALGGLSELQVLGTKLLDMMQDRSAWRNDLNNEQGEAIACQPYTGAIIHT